MNKDSFLIFFLILIAFILLFLAYQLISYFNRKKHQKSVQKKVPENTVNKCPVCESGLVGNQRIFSRVYHTESDSNQLCYIMGCPHCFPYSEMGVRRKCPVCTKQIPQEGYLVARIFYYQNKKNHVHIIGCTECNKNRIK